MMSPSLSQGTSSRGTRIASIGVAAIVGVLGVLMAHHPMILTGLRRMQTDPGDTRLNNYFLEHAYRWALGVPLHADFWSPPFYFPARNVAAYSDLLLSVAPIYAAIRALGCPPDTAFQAWMIAISALNYLAAYHLLRRRLRLGAPASCAGAFLFAFGAPRVNQMNHAQLLPQFFSLVTIDALFGLFAGAPAPAWGRAGLWLVAALGVVAQLYAGFYLGWFLLLALGVAAVAALLMRPTRGAFLAALVRDAPAIAAAAIAGYLLLRPMIAHYLAAQREVGSRWVIETVPYIPSWRTLFHMGPRSWVYGRPAWLRWFPLEMEHEKRLGIGLITTAACAAGLGSLRARPWAGLLAVVGLVLLLCVIPMPEDRMLGLATVAALAAVAGLYHERIARPRLWPLAPALMLAFTKINIFPTEQVLGLELFTLLVALAGLYRGPGGPRRRLLVGALALGLALSLFAPDVLARGALLGALAACAAEVLGLRPRPRVALVALSGMMLFACLTTFDNRPMVLLVGGSAPLALALARPARFRPSATLLVEVLIVAFMATLFYRGGDSGWHFLRMNVPGASALRALARIGLMLLIPWSIGLALFVEAMLARRRPIAAAVIVLTCVLEQGVTTRSYDKGEVRAAVAAIARRVDRRDAAFFYSPPGPPPPDSSYNDCQVDAMWAGLESGVPTINGYSGQYPPGWAAFIIPRVDEECEWFCLEVALRRWTSDRGLPPARIGWPGGPEGWRRSRDEVEMSDHPPTPNPTGTARYEGD
jgi:hypothetical protein